MRTEFELGTIIVNNIEECYIKGFEGWCVNTNKGVIYLTIDATKQCCESFGYAIGCEESENLDYYKGASIVRIEQDVSEYADFQGDEYSRGGYSNLNIVTNKGVFDLWVYNIHTGYCGHDVKIKVLDKELEEAL